jgi:regulator of replication initiation timing
MGTTTKHKPEKPTVSGASLERRLDRMIDELAELTDEANALFLELQKFRQRVETRDRRSLSRKASRAAKAKASFTCRCQQD